MARPQKFRHSREALDDPQVALKLAGLVLDIENLRAQRKQIDDQIAAAFDAVDDAGFEKKFVRKTIAVRAKDEVARSDEEQGLEAYEIAVEKGISLVRTRRERNSMPPHDAETGEIIEQNSSDLTSSPERTNMAGAEPPPSAPATNSSSVAAPAPQAQPATKEAGVDPLAASANHSEIPAFLLKDRKPLRPHCLNPTLCAGSGAKHCHRCTKALAESEAA